MNTAIEQGIKKRPENLMDGFNVASLANHEPHAPKELTLHERGLLEKSGYTIDKIDFVGHEDEHKEEDKEKKRLREVVRNQMLSLTQENALSGLMKSMKFDMALLSPETGFYKAVEEKDMLKNSKGEVVKTMEEKQEMERQGRDCKSQLAQDEIVLDEHSNQMISKQDYMINMRIRERIEYKTVIYAKIEKGEMKPEDLPEDLKKDLKDKQYLNAKPTFYDRLQIGQEELSLVPKTDKAFETSAKFTFRPEPYTAAPAPAPAM